MCAFDLQDLKQTLLLYKGPDTSAPWGYNLHESLPEHRASQLRAAEGLMGVLRRKFGGGGGGEAKSFEERLWAVVSGEKS